MGILLIVLFIQIFERVVTWLRHEVAADHLDLELVQIANYQRETSDWPSKAMALNNVWVMEIFNGVVVYLAERQGSGLIPEFLEQALPCVTYKSLGQTTLDECVICLDGFEDDEMCRVFPVCKHVFHLCCIDNWLRNH